LVESESARSLSSAFLHQALLPDLFIQTFRELRRKNPTSKRTVRTDKLPKIVLNLLLETHLLALLDWRRELTVSGQL
jgi:hypothetical protein